jgi:PTH1 family peptidyl-tRNA hydrolase
VQRESETWVVAGLGNPGPRYAGTRHDLGFALVARIADATGSPFRAAGDVEVAGPADPGGGGRAWLARPLRYMNRSGPPLARLLEQTGVPVERLLVACDDVNLPLGRIRLRPEGSAGGHNGLRSIIEQLGPGFARLRMGVGQPPAGRSQTDWVLGGFDESERDRVREMLERAAGLVRDVVAADRAGSVTSDPPTTTPPGRDPGESENEDD